MHATQEEPWLDSHARRRAQTTAIIANIPLRIVQLAVIGSLMMLYANDVLGMSPKEISGILSVLPLFNIIIPIFALPIVARFTKRDVLSMGFFVQFLAVVGLLLMPAARLTVPLFAGLLLVFAVAQRLGHGTVWHPLLREITTTEDRGQFFGRMRFAILGASTLVAALIPLVIGQHITEPQYKIVLGAVAVGIAAQVVLCRRIPERPVVHERASHWNTHGILKVLRTSPLLRRPLLINVTLAFAGIPIYILYLRKFLGVPANLVQFHVFMTILGSTLSILLWGRVSDTIGTRATLMGILLLTIPMPFLQLLLAPFPESGVDMFALSRPEMVTVGGLCLIGFLNGVFVAGTGIALTSIRHENTNRHDAVVAMNLFAMCVGGAGALATYLSGLFLELVALPAGSVAFLNGNLHLDWIKVYLLVVGLPLRVFVAWQASQLATTRPEMGIGAFFNSLTLGTLRVLFAGNRIAVSDP